MIGRSGRRNQRQAHARRGRTQTLASSCRPARISACSGAAVPSVGGGLGDRGVGLAAPVAEVDQGRDRIVRGAAERHDGRAGRGCADRARQLGQAIVELARDAAGKAWPDAARARQRRLVLGRHRARQLVRAEHREDRQRDPGADPLHRLEQAEPAALGAAAKAVQRDAVVAHLGLDQQVHRLARARQRGERARRARHQIADAADVDHGVVLTQRIERAAQARDHPAASRTDRSGARAWASRTRAA